MKQKIKKYAALLILLSVAALSFGDGLGSLGLSVNFFTDDFPDDNYSRQQVGYNANASFYYFPNDFFVGGFARLSLGSSTPGKEQNSRESMDSRKTSIFDLRAVLAPAFRLKINPKIQIPVSIGPSIVFTSETTTELLVKDSYGLQADTSKDYYYQSMSGGINADIAVIIITSKHFFFKPGVSFDYLFLRSENGEMRMNYRATHNNTFKDVNYSAFNVGINFALGLKF
jgi:hypothetical protein